MTREQFLKIYANIPINLRNEIVLVLRNKKGGKEPITWNVAYLEISGETKLGREILKKIDTIWPKEK